MSLSSRAQTMRTGPAKVRCWSAHLSSCWGSGTVRRYLLRSRRTLGLWRSGWIQLLKRSSGTRRFDRAEGQGELADPARAQQLGRQEGAAGQRCVEAQRPAGQAGRVVVEGLTRDQHHVGDMIRAAGADDELRAAPVVADHCDVAQVQFGEELGDHGGERCEGEVGVVGHRRGVRAERQFRNRAPTDGTGRPTGCRSSTPRAAAPPPACRRRCRNT